MSSVKASPSSPATSFNRCLMSLKRTLKRCKFVMIGSSCVERLMDVSGPCFPRGVGGFPMVVYVVSAAKNLEVIGVIGCAAQVQRLDVVDLHRPCLAARLAAPTSGIEDLPAHPLPSVTFYSDLVTGLR